MKLYIKTEQEFSGSLWYASLLHGMEEEARKKRYDMQFISEADDLATVFGDDKKLLVVIGTSIRKLNQQLPRLKEANIDVLLVNMTSMYTTHGVHTLTMNYEQATLRSLEYFRNCGKTRTALFCINPDSGSDMRKRQTFLSSGYSAQAVFYNTAGMASCCDMLLENISAFDSVLCANDIAILGLMRCLREHGIRVPEDLFLMGFGDTVNTELFSADSQSGPYKITTVTVDHEELGHQAVCLYSYLTKTESPIHMTGRLDSVLRIGATTAYLPDEPSRPMTIPEWKDWEQDFYDDAMVSEIIRFQTLVAESDELDRKILRMLAADVTTADMADALFFTKGAVSYRLKRICAKLGVSTRKEALEQIRRYVFW